MTNILLHAVVLPTFNGLTDFLLLLPVPSHIEGSEDISLPEVVVNKTIELICPVTGNPKPEIQWYRNNELVLTSSRVQILEDGEKLVLKLIGVNDGARYSCRATNEAGTSEKVSYP